MRVERFKVAAAPLSDKKGRDHSRPRLSSPQPAISRSRVAEGIHTAKAPNTVCTLYASGTEGCAYYAHPWQLRARLLCGPRWLVLADHKRPWLTRWPRRNTCVRPD